MLGFGLGTPGDFVVGGTKLSQDDALQNYTPSGGLLNFGGSSVSIRIYYYTASGASVFAGASSSGLVFNYSASGNAVFDSSAVVNPKIGFSASGSCVFGSGVNTAFNLGFSASGNGKFGGTSATKVSISSLAEGNAVLSGASLIQVRVAYAVTPINAVLGNSASYGLVYNYNGSGNVKISGRSDASVAFFGSGGINLGNNAVTSIILTYFASGGAVFTEQTGNGILFQRGSMGKYRQCKERKIKEGKDTNDGCLGRTDSEPVEVTVAFNPLRYSQCRPRTLQEV